MLKITKTNNDKKTESVSVTLDKVTKNIVDVDSVDIHDIRYNKDNGFIGFSFRVGYVDADNNFCAANEYPAATFEVDRATRPELWEKHKETLDAIVELFERILHEESGVTRAAIQHWKISGVSSVK